MTQSDPAVPGQVMAFIVEHVNSSPDGEVGGVLIGILEESRAVVTGFLPALKATSGSANVTFTHEVWEEILPTVDKEYPGQTIVGWYHSHPGFGVFLSEYDLFIQRNFFSDRRMLALVIDPLKGEGGWFEWESNEVVKCEAFESPVVLRTGAIKAAQETDGRRRWSTLISAVAVAALLALIGGYFLGSMLTMSTPNNAYEAQIQQLKQQNQQLQQRESTPTTSPPTLLPNCTFEYTVVAGDSLWGIAQRFFGDGLKDSVVQGDNVSALKDGLQPGSTLTIPAKDCSPVQADGSEQ